MPLQYDPVNAGFQADITCFTGRVGSITGGGGTGYSSGPTLALGAPDDPDEGVQATATATETTGVVNAPVMSEKGAGYVKVPTVTPTGGGGTGATFTAILETDSYILKSRNDGGHNPIEAILTNSDGSFRGRRVAKGERKGNVTIEARDATQFKPQLFTTFTLKGYKWVILKIEEDESQTQTTQWKAEIGWEGLAEA